MSAVPRETVKVSVITPTYNRSDFIAQAVESVLAQTMGHFELIIVDDGSTDDTKEVLAPFLADARVRYIYQENQGQSVARNTALAQASGEFVCFLDSDNYWPPEKLALELDEFAACPDADVVYGDIITINEKGDEVTRENMKRYSGNIAKHMLKDNVVSMNTAMVRRSCFSALGGMSERHRVADDYDLWLRFSARYTFHYMPAYLAYYRVMTDQISSDKSRRFTANETIIYDFRRQFPEAMTSKEFDAGFAFFHTRKARYLAMAGQKGEALREIVKALRYRSLGVAPWRGLAAVLFKAAPR